MFVEAHLLGDHPLLPAIAHHPAWTLAPGRCFVYDERDLPLGQFPGVYVSLPRERHGPGHRACAYYTGGVELVDAPTAAPELLFSFVGSRSHRVREPVLQLRHPRAVVEDTTGFVFYDDSQSDFVERQRRFDRVMWDSKFVICPRGRGTSSIRSYETLERGRVPVIVADDWVAPEGPDWDSFSVRVAERDVTLIPDLLEEVEPRFEAMAAAARSAYDEFFASGRVVAGIVDLLPVLSNEPAPQISRGSVAVAMAQYLKDRGRASAVQAVRTVRTSLRR
jgi:hypothetical protein